MASRALPAPARRLPPGRSGSPPHSLPQSERLKGQGSQPAVRPQPLGQRRHPTPPCTPRASQPRGWHREHEGAEVCPALPQHSGSPDGLVAPHSGGAALSCPEPSGTSSDSPGVPEKGQSPRPGSRPPGFRGSRPGPEDLCFQQDSSALVPGTGDHGEVMPRPQLLSAGSHEAGRVAGRQHGRLLLPTASLEVGSRRHARRLGGKRTSLEEGSEGTSPHPHHPPGTP